MCALLAPGLIAVPVAPATGTILVDVRSPAAYTARHLAGASSIPLDQLAPRLFELPAPSEDELAVVGADAAEARAAAELLEQRGWTVCTALDSSDETSWRACARAGWREAPHGSRESAPSWRANTFLRARLAEALDAAASEAARAGAAPPARARALDLGTGNGRDAVHLARALERSGGGCPAWEVVGVDNHRGALGRCEALAARAAVRVRAEHRDLRARDGSATAGWESGDVRLVHGHRFLVKPLLPLLATRVLRARGSVFLWATFAEPPGARENAVPPFKPSRRLERGELAHHFSRAEGWRVLVDEAGELVTRGEAVPAIFFAAVRERQAAAAA